MPAVTILDPSIALDDAIRMYPSSDGLLYTHVSVLFPCDRSIVIFPALPSHAYSDFEQRLMDIAMAGDDEMHLGRCTLLHC